MGDENRKWQNLSGEERYRVVELARKGMEIKELCRTFGVSRQTLYRALEASDKASVEALKRKRPGRKRPPASRKELAKVQSEKTTLEKELRRMRLKYEIAEALLDLHRKAERGERLPGEKKRRQVRASDPQSASRVGTKTPVAGGRDGGDAGSESSDSVAVEPPPED